MVLEKKYIIPIFAVLLSLTLGVGISFASGNTEGKSERQSGKTHKSKGSQESVSCDEPTNKEIAERGFTEVLVYLNKDAIGEYFSPDYIHHANLSDEGINAKTINLVNYLSGLDNYRAEVKRVIADGDYVAFHTVYEGLGPKPEIVFDVFRMEDGKFVEHWDNIIEEQPPNPSGRTQVDGSTTVTDLDKTEANKALVQDFLTKSLINQEQIDITQYINPEKYLQHNPQVADGLEGFGAFMAQMREQGMSMTYDSVYKVIGEGNFVLTMSEGAMSGPSGSQATIFYDLFRLEDGLIVEHWDVIESVGS